MAEITKTPITFEDIKEVADDNSELNMLMYGTAYGAKELLTPKAYLNFLIQLRTAKGQNANSIKTEKQLKEMGYDGPKYDFAFYNVDGERFYDLALASNKAMENKDLQFENTLAQTLQSDNQNLEVSGPDVSKDTFDAFNKQMASVFGIEMNTDTKYSVYDAKFFRSIGRKAINLVAGRSGRVRTAGTLFIAKPEFKAQEGSDERKKEEEEYYKNCIIQYTDLLAEQTTSISFADYKAKLVESPEFKALSKEEQKETLKIKKDLFKGDSEAFNSIVRDLVASEMVKTMPELNAKMRYELNQAYILRACQTLASLDAGFANDTIIIKAIQDAVKDPILKFNKRLGLTPEKVMELNAQILQKSPEGTKTLEDAIFGGKEQLYVKNFPYYFSPEAAAAAKALAAAAEKGAENVEEKDAEAGKGTDVASEKEKAVDPTTNIDVSKDTISLSEANTTTVDPTSQVEVTPESIAPEKEKNTAETPAVEESPKKERRGYYQASIEDFKEKDEPAVKEKDEDLRRIEDPSKLNPDLKRCSAKIDFEKLTQEQIELKVRGYVEARIVKAIAHVAKYAELNDDGNHPVTLKFFQNVRENYDAGVMSFDLTQEEGAMIEILCEEREKFVSRFMEKLGSYRADYEQGKNDGEWLHSKTLSQLFDNWMEEVDFENAKTLSIKKYQNGLKTFRGNYEHYIRDKVVKYQKIFVKEKEIDKGIEK